MAFRDEMGAARERAEALERENQKLKEELVRRDEAAAKERDEQQRKLELVRQEKVGPDRAKRAARILKWVACLSLVCVGGVLLTTGVPMNVALPMAVSLSLVLALFSQILNMLEVARPGEALIVSGAGSASRPGVRVILAGGQFLRIPVLHRVDRMSLEPFMVPVEVEGCDEAGGKVRLTGQAQVRIPSIEEEVRKAAERFLGARQEALVETVKLVLTGSARELTAGGWIAAADAPMLAGKLKTVAGEELHGMGLEIVSLDVQVAAA